MQTTARLLLLLNCQPEARVGIDSLRLMKCGPVDDLIRTSVLAESPPVDYIKPDYCGECPIHEVFESETPDGPRLFDACGYGEVDGEIHPDRLRRWSIDARGIAGVLAGAIPGGAVETLLPGGAWRIGDVQIGGEPFMIVLCLAKSAEQLAERSGASRMILIGDQLPPAGFAGSLTIEEAFSFDDGRVSIREHRLRQLIPLSNVGTGNAFYRKGQMWVVRFGGEEVFLENNVGPLYIARLLATPHRAVPAVTLLASRIGIDERKLTGSSGELTDEQSVAECRERYQELMRDIEEAKANNDLGQLERLQVEENKLTTHFASVLGKGGKAREASDAVKISKSVSIAIRRTMDVLAIELKPLAEHLEDSITRGITPIYSPATDIDWLV